MDEFDFDDAFNDWNVLFNRWKNRDKIKKYEIEELLEKGQIPTKMAMPFLLAIFREEVFFDKPTKQINRPENWLTQRNTVIYVLVREKELIELKEQSKGTSLRLRDSKPKKGVLTPRVQAKKDAAEFYNISVRSIENYLKKYEEGIKKHIGNIN